MISNSWNWTSADFRDLALILPEAATVGVLLKKCPKQFRNVYRKTPVPESLFKLQLYLKRDSGTGFSCEFCEIFKNTFFTENLWMTASILQQLLALYFAIICRWLLSSSEKSLVGKKINPSISRIWQI